MTISAPVYATRGDIKNALDSKETARNNSQVDAVLEAASRAVESLLHRTFYPQVATRYFDFPGTQYARPWRLWLDESELVSVTSLTSGGTAITSADYFLEPVNGGPPYDRVEIDLASASSYSSVDTPQRATTIVGTFGYDNVTTPAGALTAGAINSSVTSITCTDASVIDVGSLLTIDSEKLLVTGTSMVTTSQTMTSASAKTDTIQIVSDGTKYFVGEIILVNAERMLIVDISGNNLIVKRAWDGTDLAAHTAATVYALRTLTVVRGAAGTTAASHLASAAISVQAYPALVRELCIAEALNYLLQRASGYSRVAGAGENAVEYNGRGLEALRGQAKSAYGRQVRKRSV